MPIRCIVRVLQPAERFLEKYEATRVGAKLVGFLDEIAAR